ncbi:hypothetical protein DFH09DRAFT_1218082 [Mycena vulgaris]|nr:hypothetical protein DFH09DRAFT_1218082 [Mycena vulgaris]
MFNRVGPTRRIIFLGPVSELVAANDPSKAYVSRQSASSRPTNPRTASITAGESSACSVPSTIPSSYDHQATLRRRKYTHTYLGLMHGNPTPLCVHVGRLFPALVCMWSLARPRHRYPYRTSGPLQGGVRGQDSDLRGCSARAPHHSEDRPQTRDGMSLTVVCLPGCADLRR